MALSAQSLFLYGYTITVANQNLDFKNASGGSVLTAVIPLGSYSLTSLLEAVVTALESVDTVNTYTATANRTVMGGTQNRVTIASAAAYFSMLFTSGPNAGTSIASVLGFNASDHTGALTYTGSQTTGTTLLPAYIGYNYQDPIQQAKVFGVSNVSAAGVKEAVVFNFQNFLDVEFKYEASANLQAWNNLITWLIQQRPFDFTPQITAPSTTWQLTLEKSSADSKGLAFLMKEMLPSFPNLYQTGPMNFRVVPDYTSTIFSTG